MAAPPANALRAAPPSLIVGIDFGTWGSGFAYADLRGKGRAHEGGASITPMLHERYPGMHKGTYYPKTPTALLYRGTWVMGEGLGVHARSSCELGFHVGLRMPEAGHQSMRTDRAGSTGLPL